jgi:hypothetical protein
MKSRIITGVFCILTIICLFASLGHAQSIAGGGGSIQAPTGPTYSVPDHPMHADQGTSRPEVSLLGNNNITYAQGERPTWEFGPVGPPPTPLGDVARAYRKEHVTAEKAAIVWNQQGQ